MAIELNRGFWAGRSVFVTGASGFLGGWVVRRLLAEGAEVSVLVRDGSPRSMLVGEGDIGRTMTVHGSLEDGGLLRRAMGEYAVDTVLHLGAQPIVGVAKVNPVGTFEANIVGTYNVLDAARVNRVRQVIVASSDKAYGQADSLPYKEDTPLKGAFPYDCSKSCADLLAQCYHATYDMRVSVVRCANLFGGGDLNFSRTIPGAIKATLADQPFVIRSDGKFIRDFLYVKDAADAYLYLAEALSGGAPQGAYNFSLEVQWSVLDCANAVLSLMGRSGLTPQILNQASAEIRNQYMDCSKARTVLGWSPAYTMEQGLAETIEWYRDYFRRAAEPLRAGAAGA
ncbi:MAG: NAD-dependent epimerase/dehydratase family protein [Acidobacteriota bacterium]|nr:NAD-dependent epimerase/dehydratase family protein [Acidobacteriota bacterium]